MSEQEFTGEPESTKGGDPSGQPGPGEPVGETLPGESEPTGSAELRKPDVGFHDDASDES
jgi:hypothetical protein